MKDIFKGELVRLSAFDPDEMAKAYTNWTRDSELTRLFDGGRIGFTFCKGRHGLFREDGQGGWPRESFFQHPQTG